MTPLEKLVKSRELILEAESQLLEEKGFCPYEVGYALRKLDEAINQVTKDYS